MHWWSEIWDNWAKTWGYDRWEWGSAGEWFGGIGTALALLATIYVIRSDRLTAKRADADRLVTWVAADPRGGTPEATGVLPTVMIENTGDAPILALHVYHFDGSGAYIMYDGRPIGSRDGSLPPGQAVQVQLTDFEYTKRDRIYVKFIDARNCHWTRDAMTNKYLRRDPNPYSSYWKLLAARSRKVLSVVVRRVRRKSEPGSDNQGV